LTAAGLLQGTVVLHVVAMLPHYFAGAGQGSLASQPDQAALYAVLAAGWAAALGIGLTGPARAGVGAGMAAGLAVTEFGFRLSDLGQVLRYGSGQAQAGLWLMTAAWAVGAAGAAVAVVAAQRRARLSVAGAVPSVAGELAVPDVTAASSARDHTGVAPPPAPSEPRPARYGVGPAVVVAVLALITAGAFLPAWDHYVGVATTTGRSFSFNLGNAFQVPWQMMLGTVCAAVALAAVPIVVVRMRARAIGAAAVAGSLIVLAAQFASAVVQVDQVVPPSIAGLNATRANQLGLQMHLTLTGWFTFDLLAAFCLFVAVMVLGHAREEGPQALSAETWPIAADSHGPAALPWS
jgi:hypothetical protein